LIIISDGFIFIETRI